MKDESSSVEFRGEISLKWLIYQRDEAVLREVWREFSRKVQLKTL